MIKLTKLNGDMVAVNISHILSIEEIPETKLLLANKEYLLVQETTDEVIDKIVLFNAKVYGCHRQITIEHKD